MSEGRIAVVLRSDGSVDQHWNSGSSAISLVVHAEVIPVQMSAVDNDNGIRILPEVNNATIIDIRSYLLDNAGH